MRSDNSFLSSSVPPLKRQNNELYSSNLELSVSLSQSASEVVDTNFFRPYYRLVGYRSSNHRIVPDEPKV